jgi:hypothetical protein
LFRVTGVQTCVFRSKKRWRRGRTSASIPSNGKKIFLTLFLEG